MLDVLGLGIDLESQVLGLDICVLDSITGWRKLNKNL